MKKKTTIGKYPNKKMALFIYIYDSIASINSFRSSILVIPLTTS